MKRMLLFSMLLVLVVSLAFAQDMQYVSRVNGDTLFVKDDIDLSGYSTLPKLMTSDSLAPATRVYYLKAGGTYSCQSNPQSSKTKKTIIMGPPQNIKKGTITPPVVSGCYTTGINTTGGMITNKDLLVQNIDLEIGNSQGNPSGWAFFNFGGPNMRLHVDNCILEHTWWTWVGGPPAMQTIKFTNDYFVNLDGHSCRRNGGVLDFNNGSANQQDTLVVENCTHVNTQGTLYRFRNGFAVNRVIFNHNDFIDCAGYILMNNGDQTNLSITNNIFVNCQLQAFCPLLSTVDAGEVDADGLPMGFVNLRVNSTFTANIGTHGVYTDKNLMYWDPTLSDIVSTLNTNHVDNHTDWVSQMITMNSRTTTLFANKTQYPKLTNGTWLNKLPAFKKTDVLCTTQLAKLKSFSLATVDTSYASPLASWRQAFNPEASNFIYADFPIPIDLSYTDADLLTAGIGGFPLGDLGWFPTQLATWKAQESSELTQIQNVLNTGTTTITPTAPKNLTANPGNGQIILKWSKNTEADFLRYRIYRSTASGAEILSDSSSNSISDTTKIITGLTNGTTYYFRITAVNSSFLESGYNNEVSATPSALLSPFINPDGGFEETTLGLKGIIDVPGWTLMTDDTTAATYNIINNDVIEGKQALKVTITSRGGGNGWSVQAINEKFSLVPNAHYSYSIWAKTDKNVVVDFTVGSLSYTEFRRTVATVTTFWTQYSFNFVATTDSGRAPIWLTDQANNSLLPYTIYLDNLQISRTDLIAPQSLATIAGNGQVILKWSKNTEADFLRYRIYRGTASGAEILVDSSSNSISDTTKIMTGLTNGTTYYFRITAVNSSFQESGYSNEVSATPISHTYYDPQYVSRVNGDTLFVKDDIEFGGYTTLPKLMTSDSLAPATRVYYLKAGGTYSCQTNPQSSKTQKTIIMGPEQNIKKGTITPPVVSGCYTTGINTTGGMNTNKDLLVQNIDLEIGNSQGNPSGWAFFNFGGSGMKLQVDNCIMEHTWWCWVGGPPALSVVKFTNDYMVNMDGHSCRRNGGITDFNSSSATLVDTLLVENCTHVNFQGTVHKLRVGHTTNRAIFNHNDFIDCAGFVIMNNGDQTNLSITNNIYVNCQLQAFAPVLLTSDAGEVDADGVAMGLVNLRVDSTFTANIGTHGVYADKNLAYWDPSLSDIVSTLNTNKVDKRTDWVSQMITMNSRTTTLFANKTQYPKLTNGTWLSKLPAFKKTDVLFTTHLAKLKAYAIACVDTTYGTPLASWRQAFNPEASNFIYADFPIPIDLSYTDADLLTAGIGGFPLGDLGWFPIQLATWTAQESSELAQIQNVLNTGTTTNTYYDPQYVSRVNGDTLFVKDDIEFGGYTTLPKLMTSDSLAPATRVYYLKAGGTYSCQSNPQSSKTQKTIIMGPEQNIKKGTITPPVVSGCYTTGINTTGGMNSNKDLLVKNIDLEIGNSQGNPSGWAFFNFGGSACKLQVDNCIMEHTWWCWVGAPPALSVVKFTNDYMVNMDGHSCHRNGGVTDFNSVSAFQQDTLLVENCTHVNFQGTAYKLRVGYRTNRAIFNHNDFIDCAGFVIMNNGDQTNLSITNNIYVNCQLQAFAPVLLTSDVGEVDADGVAMGFVNLRVDSTFTANIGTHGVYADKNLAYWDPSLSDIVTTLNTNKVDKRTDWVSQMITMNSRTTTLFANKTQYPKLTNGTWLSKLPAFKKTDVLFTTHLAKLKAYAIACVDTTYGTPLASWRQAFNPEASNFIYADFPIPIDLSYTDADLLTAGIGGFPLGDLGWFPTQLATWKAQESSELTQIQNVLNNGTTIKLPPVAPQNLTATAGNAQVTLKWNKNTEADFLRYRIYRGTASSAEISVDSSSNSISDTTKIITGLTNGTAYYFRITAVNSSFLESGYSNEVSATPINITPTISSFYPTSGPIGTTVTITGINFSTIPANNIVYFGAVKAVVTTASTTSLSVTVPTSATYQPITVTVNGLTAYTSKPFIITFSSSQVIDATSFAPKVNYTTGTNPYNIAIADFDGDGKPDLVVTNFIGNTVSAFRNTSTAGNVSFASKVDFTAGLGANGIAIGDVDGDGKPDLVVANSNNNTISVFRNTSTIGSISFTAKVDFATGSWPCLVAIGDLDGDGKPDVAVTNCFGNTVSVFWNMSSIGGISFAPKVDYVCGNPPVDIKVSDFDGDGKPDLAVTNAQSNTFSVFRNTSIIGSISFAAKMDFAADYSPTNMNVGDLDGDGKPDIAVTDAAANLISMFRNTSTIGNITFAAKVDFVTGGNISYCSAIGDLNGDGKPDLVVTNRYSNIVSVIQNTSVSSNITFATMLGFASGNWGVAIGDIDGDGKPDIAVADTSSNSISILRNTMGGSNTAPLTPQNLTATAGNGQVTLKWNKNTEVNFLKYRIYMETDSNAVSIKDSSLNSLLDTTKLITGLTNGTKYFFRVSALNSARLESGQSWAALGIPNASIIPAGLVAWYPFNGNANDSSGNGNFGITYGVVPTKNRFGADNSAYSFSGSNNFIAVNNSPSLNQTTAVTVTAWVYVDGGTGTSRAIIGKIAPDNGYSSYSLSIDQIDRLVSDLTFSDKTGYGLTGSTLTQNVWHFVTMTYDSIAWKTYLDGKTPGAMTLFKPLFSNAYLLHIGCDGTETQGFFKGSLDDIRIYNRALSQFEITQLYTEGGWTGGTNAPPSAPTNLTASVISGSQINLSWTDAANNEDGFKIERKIGAGGTYALLATLGANVQSYPDTGLAELTTYYYRVCAYNSAGNSGYSNEANTITKDVSPPAAPTAAQITPSDWTNQNTFNITWTNSSDPSGIAKLWYMIDTIPNVTSPGKAIVTSTQTLQLTVSSAGTHQIYFFLEDGAGNKDPNNRAQVIAKYDNVAPIIQHDSLVVASFETSAPQAVSISASTADPFSGVRLLQLQYRRSGLSWSTSVMVPFTNASGGSVSIPANYLTSYGLYGVDYRLIATDSAGNVSYTPTHSINIHDGSIITRSDQSGNPIAQVGASSLASGTPPEYAYRMFSVPLNLDNKTPQDVFGAKTGLGAYDPMLWRLFRLDTSDQFVEYSSFSSQSVITPGSALFLILKNGIAIKTGPGSTLKAEDYSKNGIVLKKGYNAVGNPFNFDLPMDSLSLSNGLFLSGRTWEYVGAGGTNGGWKLNPTTLKAWEGVVINLGSNGPATLRFNVTDRLSAVNPSSPTGMSKKVSDGTRTKENYWSVRIRAEREDNKIADIENILGVDPMATDDVDTLDVFEPPLIGDKSISVSFNSKEGALTHDYRVPGADGYVWDFKLKTPDENARTKLTFNGIDSMSVKNYLIDLQSKMVYQLIEKQQLMVNTGKGTRNFRLIVGSKSFAEANSMGIDLFPKDYVLYQNYPNPFNPSTMIRFSLPAKSSVRLMVYDLLGREVTRLIDREMSEGYQEVEWNASVSTGIYFCRLEASATDGSGKKYNDVRKMVLMK